MYAHSVCITKWDVLVAGGNYDLNPKGAELYDSLTGNWRTTGFMKYGRDKHTATVLPNKQVLVIGGYNFRIRTGAELYDPSTESWTTVDNMINWRYWHTASVLINGTVLVTGGYNGTAALHSAELYDP